MISFVSFLSRFQTMYTARTPFAHFLSPSGSCGPGRASSAPSNRRKNRSFLILKRFIRHLSFVNLLSTHLLAAAPLSTRQRQGADPPNHASKKPPVQMSFRQQQPVVAGMFHQPSTGLHQPLLQARQRPVLDSLGQRQPPPRNGVVDHAPTRRFVVFHLKKGLPFGVAVGPSRPAICLRVPGLPLSLSHGSAVTDKPPAAGVKLWWASGNLWGAAYFQRVIGLEASGGGWVCREGLRTGP